MSTAAEIERWRRNLQDEVDSAELYRLVAAAEEDASLASVYRRLADVEQRHAEFWAKRLRDAGQPVREMRVGWRTRLPLYPSSSTSLAPLVLCHKLRPP